jgi:hypothetical protein
MILVEGTDVVMPCEQITGLISGFN